MEASGWPDALPRPGNRGLERLPSVDPWFEIYRVRPETYALLEPLHYEEVISYLIVGDRQAVLFDTGMGIGNIQAEVTRLTGRPVVVVNSHGHYDHVGDNHRFAQVMAFDDDREVARIEAGKPRAACAGYLARGWYLSLPAGFDPATYEIRPSRVTHRLRHGEVIALGGRNLVVHHTPGHSPGSLCLLDSREGLLFTGDTFYPGMLYAHFADSDLAAYRRSLRELLALAPQVSALCPAHNEAWVPTAMLGRVDRALEQVTAGLVPFEPDEGMRVYRFDGFGLMLPGSETEPA